MPRSELVHQRLLRVAATQRHLILAAIQTEHRRIVTLVDDLDIKVLP